MIRLEEDGLKVLVEPNTYVFFVEKFKPTSQDMNKAREMIKQWRERNAGTS